jgi:hypothetical protein
MSDLVEFCGLWKNESKGGKTYYSGKLGPYTRVMLFFNEDKKAENHPDAHIKLGVIEKKEEGGAPF